MILDCRGSRATLALVVALLALAACSDSGSPTAPVATESSPTMSQASAADRGDGLVMLWGTVMGDPEIVTEGDRTWVRLMMMCSQSEEGMETPAVFLCEGGLLDSCAALKQFDEILAMARYEGQDGQDFCPVWNVARFRKR